MPGTPTMARRISRTMMPLLFMARYERLTPAPEKSNGSGGILHRPGRECFPPRAEWFLLGTPKGISSRWSRQREKFCGIYSAAGWYIFRLRLMRQMDNNTWLLPPGLVSILVDFRTCW